MTNWILSFIMVLFTFKLDLLDAQKIMVYTNNHGKGSSSELDISKCANLPETMQQRINSVDTKNKCAQFYSGKDCTGDSIEMMARSPSHGALYNLDFNNKMVSAGPCRDECSLNVTGPVPPAEGVNLTIYGEPRYKGPVETITIRGCTPVPRKFNYRVQSVNTTDNENCFQLYNNWNCQVSAWRDNNQFPVQDSIELRRGTVFHDDLSRWSMHRVKAISHCSYKCRKRSEITEAREVAVTKVNQIRLHDEAYFHGDSVQLEIQPGACMNLADGWEGATYSLQVYKKNSDSGNAPCFIMFQQKNCSGQKSEKVDKSDSSLSGHFAGKTRSILNCNENNDSAHVNGQITKLGNNETGNGRNDKFQHQEKDEGAHFPIILSIFAVLTVGIVLTGIFICYKKKIKFGTAFYSRDNDVATSWNRMTH